VKWGKDSLSLGGGRSGTQKNEREKKKGSAAQEKKGTRENFKSQKKSRKKGAAGA